MAIVMEIGTVILGVTKRKESTKNTKNAALTEPIAVVTYSLC